MRLRAFIAAVVIAATPAPVLGRTVIIQLYEQFNKSMFAAMDGDPDYERLRQDALNLAAMDYTLRDEYQAIADAIENNEELLPYFQQLVNAHDGAGLPSLPSQSLPRVTEPTDVAQLETEAELSAPRIVRVPYGRSGDSFVQGDMRVRVESDTITDLPLRRPGTVATVITPGGCPRWVTVTFTAYDGFEPIMTWQDSTYASLEDEVRVSGHFPRGVRQSLVDYIEINRVSCN